MRAVGGISFHGLILLAGLVAGCQPAIRQDSTSNDPGVIHQFTPGAFVPLSETSFRIDFTAPDLPAARELVVLVSDDLDRAPDTQVAGLSLSPTATSAVVTGISPGTVGQVVVGAVLPAKSFEPQGAPGIRYWTPFGALNEESVSSVTPLTGYSNDSQAQGLFISPTFSLLLGHLSRPELSHVYGGVPVNGERPLFNLASLLISHSGGFSLHSQADYGQVWSDGASRAAVVQGFGANRVLLYDPLPLSPDRGKPAVILGQGNFTGLLVNGGQGSVHGGGFSLPYGVCFTGTRLYVSDAGNHRILGWNGWPTQTGRVADFILGQSLPTASTANAGGRSRTSLHTPQGLACDGGRLAVADTGNNRVLIWHTAPDSAADPADVVLGQVDGGSGGANGAGGVDQGGLNAPASVLFMPNGGGTAVLVADYNSHRVVQWDSIPASDGPAFDRVYGQPDRLTTALNSGGGAGANTLGGPGHLAREQGSDRFWVSENVNSRLTVWKLGEAASVGLYGQRTVSNRGLFHGSSGSTRVPWSRTSSLRLSLDPQSGLTSLTGCGGRLWNAPPTDGTTPFDAVQGSPDYAHCDGSTVISPVSQMGPFSAVRVGTRVYWTDTDRILSRDGGLSGANSVPDLVLGRVDFNGNIVTPNTYDYRIDPTQLATDGTRLYAVDGPRIVGWDAAPTASNTAIDFALGQGSKLTRNVNDGGLGASSLSADVRSILATGGKFFAVDTGNHRVLIWNTPPDTTGAAADVVLGQPDALTAAPGTGLDGMDGPTGVALSGGKLLVSDRGNRRVLVWDTVPTQDGVPADRVWLPGDFSFGLPTWFNLAGSWNGAPIWAPERIHAYEGKLYLNYLDRIPVLPDIF